MLVSQLREMGCDSQINEIARFQSSSSRLAVWRFRHWGNWPPAFKPGNEIVRKKLSHGIAGQVRCRTHMRQQHHVLKCNKLCRNARLVGEHIEAGGEDCSFFQ